MSQIRDKIEKTLKAIVKAEANGDDTTMWQKYLIQLVDKLDKDKVRIKAGKFGFCTCTGRGSLCSGCWRIPQKCECVVRDVNPDEVINWQKKTMLKGVH